MSPLLMLLSDEDGADPLASFITWGDGTQIDWGDGTEVEFSGDE